jgi:CelD/BcsL family acetyltransferase involved in cellulose biosynthesis
MGAARFHSAQIIHAHALALAVNLDIQLITALAELEQLAPEWDALTSAIAPRIPFATPLWNLLWWQYFHGCGHFVRDQLNAYVFRDARGDLIAVAPMMVTQRPAFGPFRTRELQFFGADPNMTEIRGIVCRPEHEAAVFARLQQHLLATPHSWHWFSWLGIRSRESLPAHSAAATEWVEPIPNYYLSLPDSWETFRSGLSRNIKESLRKCYNSLKRDQHSFTFRIIESPEAAPAALDRFFALHGMRAAADVNVRHNDVFASANARAFLADYALNMAQRGQLRIFQIEIAGQIIATRLGFAFNRSLYLYYSGYDPAWGRYSIMTTVVAETIKWAIENGYETVNLSTGNDVSKTRWSPNTAVFAGAVLRAPTPSARLAFFAYYRVIRNNRLVQKLLARGKRGQ